MKNAPATFQRMINKIIAGLPGCEGYIDNVAVYAETWEEHLHRLKQLFLRLRESQLTVKLAKTELECALTRLLCKDQKFVWDMKCTETFKKIKGLLMSAPVLITPQFDKPFVLMVDTSDPGVGGMLLHKD